MPVKPKPLVITSEEQDPKKHSVRYNFPSGSAIDNVYVKRSELEKIGTPDNVKITIEPA